MNKLIILLALTLCGCATNPPQVVVGSVPSIDVPRVVIQPCIDPATLKPLPETAMPPRTAPLDALGVGAYADLLRYRDLAREQQKLLRDCSALPPH